MPRVRGPALQKHTVRLYEGDFARLHDLFPEVDTNLVLRNIVRKFLEKAELPPSASVTELPPLGDL